MKKIYNLFLTAAVLMLSLTGCSDQEPFITAGPDDTPRFLAPSEIEESLEYSVTKDRNEVFTMDIVVTPANYTTIQWIADGEVLGTGMSFSKQFEAGDYVLKILAVTTNGKEASRVINLKVKPLADDPVANDKPAERLQSPGAAVRVSGKNLSKITAVSVGGNIVNVTGSAADYIEYIVPEGLTDGQYRISLIDAENNSYGGGMITITSSAAVLKNSFSATSGDILEISGCKLSSVVSVTIGGQDCEILSKEDSKVTVKVPELEEGDYEVKAFTTSGAAVKFLSDEGLVEVASVKITLIAENVLWEGKHAVDWGSIWEDSDGSVTTNLKENAKVGYTLRLYLKRTDAEYALGCAAVGWADIVNGGTDSNRGDVNISFEETYIDFVLTAKSFELLDGGNLQVVGHGFDLLKMTLIPPAEVTLWEGKHAVDWDSIWEDNDGTVTTQIKENSFVGSVLRLYVKRTDAEYALGCAAVGWADIVSGGTDSNRADVNITFEDTVVEFELTAKSFELLGGGNLQVVGHGFDLLKITIQ